MKVNNYNNKIIIYSLHDNKAMYSCKLDIYVTTTSYVELSYDAAHSYREMKSVLKVIVTDKLSVT